MTLESLAIIVESVADADPLAGNRSRPVVEARALLASALRAYGWTLHQIGEAIGFHHTSVLHYGKMLYDAQRYNPILWDKWIKLKSILDL